MVARTVTTLLMRNFEAVIKPQSNEETNAPNKAEQKLGG